jgi:dimethylargininase
VRAIVRRPSAALRDCALTFLERQPIDLATAKSQHDRYIEALQRLGVNLLILPPADDLPDSVFVEDTAIVLDEVAVITRPGITVRQPEVATIATALREFRPIVRIEPPGTLEGGDVLRIGRTLFVGQTARTNADGTRQLEQAIVPHGYEIVPVVPTGCLHLKSAVTYAGRETVVLNPEWVDVDLFARWQCVPVPVNEPTGANVLLVGDTVHVAASAPDTSRKLAALGFDTAVLDTSEFEKAEAALTCLSLLFQ